MAGNAVRLQAGFLLHHLQGGNTGGQNCGLGVVGQLEVVFRTVETEGGELETQCVISLFKHLSCHREVVRKILAHAGILGTLPREQKRRLTHKNNPL